MNTHIFEVSLFDGPLPIIVDALALILLVVVASRGPRRRWLPRFAIAAVIGLVIGFLLAWLIGDVWNAFGITLTFVTRLWFASAISATCVALTSLWRPRWTRALLAVPAVAVFLLAAAIGINADFGEFPTLAAAFGLTHVSVLALTGGAHGASKANGPLWQTWTPPAGMPRTGRIGTAAIKGSISHFTARDAIVYVPPAALVKDPPALPVLEFLSGQPGSPQDILNSAQLPAIMGGFARAHGGLAPIVVVPDQLGSPGSNPMCLNSHLGNVATYLTIDVPNWIRAHFRVLTEPKYWAIGGYSEGGTCSIQLGATYPTIFGGILDVSGELVPANGSVQHTISVGFNGSKQAYDAAMPLHALAANAPFTGNFGVFGVGQNDVNFAAGQRTLVAAARAAGMTAQFVQSPGTAHDWHTLQYVVHKAIPSFFTYWGLAK